ncbi:metal ABC transporter ATP-binding protein [Methanoplanus limicola]|uniref:ABC transporter related protein n=1 Tax=Methanoplanus limicola DSM 2279 TaxID=937775 RepID=H1Z3X3_9EURY|nr:ABC transporter ATP-binding protein [Methanoplanus limicola]EHQ36595.1 ABC transporter related protein [Methanoplanus limicola DSM 2279]
MKEPAIEINNLTVMGGGHPLLDNIDLTINRGEFHAIIGPNGGGKTTLLKVILGLIKPDSGSVKIFGKKPEENRSLIGYVPQFRTFEFGYPISVMDMVLSGRMGHIKGIRKTYSEDDIRIAEESIEILGIEGLAGRNLTDLSGGEQQRAIIARALAGKPEMLLLDEPTVYVDTPTNRMFFKMLEELHDRMTILLVTHDIGVISSDIDYVACLNRKIYTHHTNQITQDMLDSAYKCPVDIIAHGIPHRVFQEHDERDNCGGLRPEKERLSERREQQKR